MKSFQSLSSKTTVLSVSPLLLPKHRGCNPSHSLKFRSIPSDFLPNRYYDLRIEFSSITMRRALYKAPIAYLKLIMLHWKKCAISSAGDLSESRNTPPASFNFRKIDSHNGSIFSYPGSCNITSIFSSSLTCFT